MHSSSSSTTTSTAPLFRASRPAPGTVAGMPATSRRGLTGRQLAARVLAVLLAVLAGLVVLGAVVGPQDQRATRTPASAPAPAGQPLEDEAGWDCRADGNAVCGPVPPATVLDYRTGELDTTSATTARRLAQLYPAADVYLVHVLPASPPAGTQVVWASLDTVGIHRVG